MKCRESSLDNTLPDLFNPANWLDEIFGLLLFALVLINTLELPFFVWAGCTVAVVAIECLVMKVIEPEPREPRKPE